MTTAVISDNLKEKLLQFLKKNRKAELVTTYFYFLEEKFNISPVLFPKERTIYQSKEELLRHLEKEGKLWRETQIKIQIGPPAVNTETKKIYICPFTGKVFGDNTHPNPQDAIYDWVSKCPENTERSGGLKVKRFFVSEDPEIIKNYVTKRKEPITKTVYSSGVTGKLFNSKKAVIDDFTSNQIKSMSLVDVTSQNRFQIQEDFFAFIQRELEESKIAGFFEAVSSQNEFAKYIPHWLEEVEEAEETEDETA